MAPQPLREVLMDGEPTTFWGKLSLSEGGRVTQWHPLVDHCADVAAVVEGLLQLGVWRSRMARLAGRDLRDGDIARLCVIAALHDLGKFNLGFQAKGVPRLGPTAGHVQEGLAAVFHIPSLAVLGQWGDAATSLLVSAIGHHGRPHDLDSAAASWQRGWWSRRGSLEPQAGVAQLVQLTRGWFPLAHDASVPALPVSTAFSHAFAGLVMLADWIGSDTRLFPYSHSLDGMRMSFARDSAATALKDLGLNVDASERTDDQGRTSFRRVCPSDSAPRSSQAALLGLPAESGGSISVLEAETGSGKTEAALARFVDLFEEGLVDGMYFALPTRTAATQMHARVRVAAQRAFPHPPAVVLAVPGYLRVDDADGERQRLPSFDVQWPDQDRYRYRGWPAENAKRFLVGCIVVGTVDQVLLSALMVNHAHLRATALLRHLLVVDEVHASDAYMVRVLENVLARHLASGGHALLLSATLGGEARQRLLDPTGRVQGLSLADAIGTPYPLVSYQSQSAGCISVTAGGASRDIHLTTQPWMSEPALVAEAARDMAARGAKVLVIRNTVRDCIATQMELESLTGLKGEDHLLFGVGDHPAPHHARFARVDRHLLDKAIEESFGGNRRAGGLVCVATQTVQQSLDLDADVMLTDLCPADVLLQRIGRLHRHDRSRPVGFAEAAAVVMVPECRDLEKLIRDDGTVTPHHGLGSVYADLRIMEATWRLFEAHVVWAVPAMNRTLVENCVHSEVTSMIGEQAGARWRQHGIQVEGRLRAQARLAQLNLVDWSVPYETMSFPDSSSQRIPTRLGEGDRTAAFPEPVPGPFGHLIGEITVPGWMAHEVPTDAETENVSAAGGAIQFTFGGRRFRYDRHGLRTDEA